jgi:hypothetical protein
MKYPVVTRFKSLVVALEEIEASTTSADSTIAQVHNFNTCATCWKALQYIAKVQVLTPSGPRTRFNRLGLYGSSVAAREAEPQGIDGADARRTPQRR